MQLAGVVPVCGANVGPRHQAALLVTSLQISNTFISIIRKLRTILLRAAQCHLVSVSGYFYGGQDKMNKGISVHSLLLKIVINIEP
jgi:hypothetical protein